MISLLNKPLHFLILISLCFFLASLSTSYAEDLFEDGGIGGTGIIAMGDPDEDGGIGGTGIVGTITGFGSIYVNGHRITYDNNLLIETKDGIIGPKDLKLGQVIAVETEAKGDIFVAQNARLQYEVAGPIGAIDETGNRIEVMGQIVELSENTQYGSFSKISMKTGQFVEVSGLRSDENTIQASRLDLGGNSRNIALRGRISAADDMGFYIGQKHIKYEDVEGLRNIEVGKKVDIVGPFNGRRLRARIESDIPFEGRMKNLSVEGFLQRHKRRAGYRLGNMPIDKNNIASFAEGSVNDLTAGRRVFMRGQIDKERQLRIHAMHMKPQMLRKQIWQQKFRKKVKKRILEKRQEEGKNSTLDKRQETFKQKAFKKRQKALKKKRQEVIKQRIEKRREEKVRKRQRKRIDRR